MLIIVIFLIIMITIMYISYKRLNSFNKKSIKILIVVILCILVFIMQVGLTVFGLMNNDSLEEMGKGLIFLVLLIPTTIIFAEAILMPLYTYLINKYNKGKISRRKFAVYIMIIVFLNNIGVLWFYV